MALTGTPARWVREMDRPPDGVTATATPIDTASILGTWRNTNLSTRGISRAVLTARDGQIWMRVWGADPDGGRHDWGETVVDRLYADGPFSKRVSGYFATFDLGHARSHVQANFINGLTVMAVFTTFTDGSGRASYLSREFYYRRGGAQ